MALGPNQQSEVERIQSKLAEFLPAVDARELAKRIHDLTVEIDEEIGRILKDPLIGELYEYDGQFFTPRGTQHFHTAFDGFHLLKSLGNYTIETLFREQQKRSAVRLLLDELKKHSWVAKRRRMNWEESRTLGLLTNDVIQEILNLHDPWRQAGENPTPLTSEEQAFFKFFEDEMKRTGSRH